MEGERGGPGLGGGAGKGEAAGPLPGLRAACAEIGFFGGCFSFVFFIFF